MIRNEFLRKKEKRSYVVIQRTLAGEQRIMGFICSLGIYYLNGSRHDMRASDLTFKVTLLMAFCYI